MMLKREADTDPARRDYPRRALREELSLRDAFGILTLDVVGRQLSVGATRAILAHLQERFGGHLPSPQELQTLEPQELRASGMSKRKAATLRSIAERFTDGQFSDELFAHMSNDEVEADLTEVPGIGPSTARGFLILALHRTATSDFRKEI